MEEERFPSLHLGESSEGHLFTIHQRIQSWRGSVQTLVEPKIIEVMQLDKNVIQL